VLHRVWTIKEDIGMSFEIIDFHTHPFLSDRSNICAHKEFCGMTAESTREIFRSLGVSKICGSVVSLTKPEDRNWNKIRMNNDEALKLKEVYNDFYIPGFHVHAGYVDESIAEIKRMHSLGIRLVGELVPYLDGWSNYASEEFSVLLDEIGKHDMVVSFHSGEEDAMDEMVKKHPDVVFVAAHPGEYNEFMRHIARMKMSENYYLDLSGYGPFRYGMIRRAIDECGLDRILFGSDYPTCSPAMYIGSVLLDPLLTDTEKEHIFSLNAKKLLGL